MNAREIQQQISKARKRAVDLVYDMNRSQLFATMKRRGLRAFKPTNETMREAIIDDVGAESDRRLRERLARYHEEQFPAYIAPEFSEEDERALEEFMEGIDQGEVVPSINIPLVQGFDTNGLNNPMIEVIHTAQGHDRRNEHGLPSPDTWMTMLPSNYPYYLYAVVYRKKLDFFELPNLIAGAADWANIHAQEREVKRLTPKDDSEAWRLARIKDPNERASAYKKHFASHQAPALDITIDNIIKTAKAYLINDDKDKEQYHQLLFGSSTTNAVGVDVRIIPISGPQRLIRVSRFRAGNCVMNIIKGGIQDANLKKIYRKLPRLKATKECPNPFISPEDIKIIHKIAKIDFRIFSRLGAITGDVWSEFIDAKGKRKRFDLVFGNGHATVYRGSVRVQAVKYLEPPILDPSCTGEFTDYVDIGYAVEHVNAHSGPPIVNYYVRLINNEFVMFKSYRPSTVTGDPEDDRTADYAYCTNNIQTLSRVFRKRYELSSIKSPLIKSVVISAEHFIGSKRFGDTAGCSEIDMNKCYVSYKNNKYYVGFPTLDLYPIVGESEQSQFYLCSITNVPVAFRMLMQYNSDDIVLTRPVVRWLRDNGATVTTKYSLVGPTRDVDIISFANEHADRIGDTDMKLFRNSMIGRCIAGGIKGTHAMTCKYSEEAERDQIIYEASQHNYKLDLMDDQKIIRVYHKNDTRGAFHYHSFVLGYALASVADMMQKIINGGGKIMAYNVDAIVYKGNDPTDFSTAEFGGWKIDRTAKLFYNKIGITEPSTIPRSLPDFFANLTIPNELVNTVIAGPGGIGKSWPFLTKPYPDQIFLVPRCILRDEHRKTQNDALGYNNVVTMQKYFQPSVSDEQWLSYRARRSIPQRHKIVIIDEFTMCNKAVWTIIMDRAKQDNSIIIALGDFEQIRDEIDSDPITQADFNDWGFKTIAKERVNGQPARHSFEDGTLLDTLRNKPPMQQVSTLFPHVKKTIEELITYEQGSIHIAGSHARCHKINMAAAEVYRKSGELFPCRNIKHIKHLLSPDDPAIWWRRLSMRDVMPKEYKYEPAYSVTADSVQGMTFDNMVYVDDNLRRHGAFYTAVCRPRLPREHVTMVVTGEGVIGDCTETVKKISPEKAPEVSDDLESLLDQLTNEPSLEETNMKIQIDRARRKNNPPASKPVNREVVIPPKGGFWHSSECEFNEPNTHRIDIGKRGEKSGNKAFRMHSYEHYVNDSGLVRRLLLDLGDNFHLNEYKQGTDFPLRFFIDIDIGLTDDQIVKVIELLSLYFVDPNIIVLQNTESKKVHIITNAPMLPCECPPAYENRLSRDMIKHVADNMWGIGNVLGSIYVKDWLKAVDSQANHSLRAPFAAKIANGVKSGTGVYVPWVYGKESTENGYNLDSIVNIVHNSSIYRPTTTKWQPHERQYARDLLKSYTTSAVPVTSSARLPKDIDQQAIDKLIAALPAHYLRGGNGGGSWMFLLRKLKNISECVPNFKPEYFLHEWSRANNNEYNEDGNNASWSRTRGNGGLAGDSYKWLVDTASAAEKKAAKCTNEEGRKNTNGDGSTADDVPKKPYLTPEERIKAAMERRKLRLYEPIEEGLECPTDGKDAYNILIEDGVIDLMGLV